MIELEAEHLLRLAAFTRQEPEVHRMTGLPGGFLTRARGRGLETADLRAFAYGDDPRHIDRNATARTGALHVRTFHAERDRTLILVADFRPSMLWGTRRTLRSVAAAEALTIAGWRAVRNGARVGLVAALAGQPVLVPARGRDRGMVNVIGGMVRAHASALRSADSDEPELSETLEVVNRVALRGAHVMLASGLDNPGAGLPDAVSALSERTTIEFIRVVDAFETDPPPGTYRYRTISGHAGLSTGRASQVEQNSFGMPQSTYFAGHAPDMQPNA